MTDVMTTTAAARVLHLSPEQVRRYCESGALRAQKFSGIWAISRDDVLRMKYQKFYQFAKERR